MTYQILLLESINPETCRKSRVSVDYVNNGGYRVISSQTPSWKVFRTHEAAVKRAMKDFKEIAVNW